MNICLHMPASYVFIYHRSIQVSSFGKPREHTHHVLFQFEYTREEVGFFRYMDRMTLHIRLRSKKITSKIGKRKLHASSKKHIAHIAQLIEQFQYLLSFLKAWLS